MVRVILADDHHIVRQSLVSLLNGVEDIEVTGEAADGQEIVKLVKQQRPDIVVMDISMPLLNGIDAIHRIQALETNTNVIILSMYSDETMVRQAFKNGAKGYLLKQCIVDELIMAIRTAAQGHIYLSPAISQTILSGFLHGNTTNEEDELNLLSTREREILQMIAEGHTNQAMAQMLDISPKTIEKHRSNIMVKLDAHNLPALIRIALKNRLIFLEE